MRHEAATSDDGDGETSKSSEWSAVVLSSRFELTNPLQSQSTAASKEKTRHDAREDQSATTQEEPGFAEQKCCTLTDSDMPAPSKPDNKASDDGCPHSSTVPLDVVPRRPSQTDELGAAGDERCQPASTAQLDVVPRRPPSRTDDELGAPAQTVTEGLTIVVRQRVLVRRFVDRIRARVQKDQLTAATRIGSVMLMISVVHLGVLTAEIFARRQSAVAADFVASDVTSSLSGMAVFMHIILMVPHGPCCLLWAHYFLFTARCAITGSFHLWLGNHTKAAYNFIIWLGLIYPVCGFALNKFLLVAKKFNLATRTEAANVTLLAFAAGFPSGMYLTLNSAACVAFVNRPTTYCATRIEVNYGIIVSLGISSWIPALLVFEPVTFVNLVHFQLLAHQWLAAVAGAGLFLCCIVLLASSERFSTVPYHVNTVIQITNICVVVIGIVTAVGVSRRAGYLARQKSSDQSNVSSTMAVHFGDLRPWLLAMSAVTTGRLFVVTWRLSGWDQALGPIAMSCACFHIWIAADGAHARWELVHYIVFMSPEILDAVRAALAGQYDDMVRNSLYAFVVCVSDGGR